MLEEVWEPGYVGGDQQRQGIGYNLFLNLYEYNYWLISYIEVLSYIWWLNVPRPIK